MTPFFLVHREHESTKKNGVRKWTAVILKPSKTRLKLFALKLGIDSVLWSWYVQDAYCKGDLISLKRPRKGSAFVFFNLLCGAVGLQLDWMCWKGLRTGLRFGQTLATSPPTIWNVELHWTFAWRFHSLSVVRTLKIGADALWTHLLPSSPKQLREETIREFGFFLSVGLRNRKWKELAEMVHLFASVACCRGFACPACSLG